MTKKNMKLKYMKIGEILKDSQYGISIEMNEVGTGYHIYRMNEIHNMICDKVPNKFADISNKELETFRLNNRDVLFNRTNSYEFVGRTGIYYGNSSENNIFASYLVRFVPKQEYIYPEYLTAFLNSRIGIKEIKRRARQSINQTNVNPEEVKDIDIPILKIELQKMIEENFQKANELKNYASKEYEKAMLELLDDVEIKFDNQDDNIAIKKLSETFNITRRLDAEYYKPKYNQIENNIKNYRNGYKNLQAYIKDYSTGYAFKSNTYCNEGAYLIRINNMNENGLNLQNAVKIPYKDINLSEKDIVRKNDILISMSGTIGLSCIIKEDIKGVINQRIFRFTPKGLNGDVLCLILNSCIGRYQLERIGTGGVQVNISSNDIKNILIPDITKELQIKIHNYIENSYKATKLSEKLLYDAKNAVEIAIEEDEEEAIKFIKGNRDEYLQ